MEEALDLSLDRILNEREIFQTKVVEKTKTHILYSVFFPPKIYEIYSFSILSDDRSKAASKTIPPHSAI